MSRMIYEIIFKISTEDKMAMKQIAEKKKIKVSKLMRIITKQFIEKNKDLLD